MKAEASGMLAVQVLEFCLPAELFNAMVMTSTKDLPDWRFFVATAIGLMGMSLVAYAAAAWIFKKPMNEAGLQTLNAAFPNIAFVGLPVILAVTGKSGMVFAVIAVIVSSLLQPPFALTLLAAGSPEQQGQKGLSLLAHSVWDQRQDDGSRVSRESHAQFYESAGLRCPAPLTYLHACASVAEARAGLGRYLNLYNGRRLHSSLGTRTPDQNYFTQAPLLAAA